MIVTQAKYSVVLLSIVPYIKPSINDNVHLRLERGHTKFI